MTNEQHFSSMILAALKIQRGMRDEQEPGPSHTGTHSDARSHSTEIPPLVARVGGPAEVLACLPSGSAGSPLFRESA